VEPWRRGSKYHHSGFISIPCPGASQTFSPLHSVVRKNGLFLPKDLKPINPQNLK
jgi:hypothetical protein